VKLTLTSTDQITTIGGVQCRVWQGVTEAGVACTALVHRIAVPPGQDATQFERELQEKLPPGRFVPLSLVLP
jgi:thiamine monophosphate synthase